MKTITADELQARLREVLDQVIKNGQPIALSYGKQQTKVAAIVPYSQVKPKTARTLGLMKERARCIIHDDFALTDEHILHS
ncbi:MAG: type II toxin-antitoxin system Phd/YefM family antitoxin [Pseudomonadales bacterium]|jgi:antitoxin (DNA-binding transcriptional repressor) of toxin-antitoxin stability system|nr:type II toxin-antitoxin system Phd/YefM family antitoxin [Pseudomonadales bacterium]